MIESVAQIGCKITACCHFMQTIKSWLVPRMLAAGANGKVAVLRNFRGNELCNSNGSFIPSAAFLFFFKNYHCHQHQSLLQKVSFIWKTFELFNDYALCVTQYWVQKFFFGFPRSVVLTEPRFLVTKQSKLC